jgi:predicted peptidase
VTTRRGLFPLIAGAAGLATSASAAKPAVSEPELRRVPYASKLTGAERDYFVYLPRGHAQKKSWPVILFLHGDGERGDGKADLDYTLQHGPMYEAWIQRRDLPFVIITPQLPLGTGWGDDPFFRDRAKSMLPQRTTPPPPRPDENNSRRDEPMRGAAAADPFPEGPDGDTEGWQGLEADLIAILDNTIAGFRGDPRRIYVTGLSRGGFGTWHFAARHADRIAAIVPVAGFGHPDLAAPIAAVKMPLWQFAGGRDEAVPIRQMYPMLNRLEAMSHPDVRFTIHADLGHFVWVRVYGGQDVYNWMLSHSKA